MEWSQELVAKIPKDKLLELIIELLSRMGFKNYEKVTRRDEWGIDIVALREDPLSGTEKIIIKVHDKGLATASEVSMMDSLIDRYKADRGILISPSGFTKDARIAVSKNYRGRVLLWDGDKLIKSFRNYGINVPEDFKISERKEEKKKTIPEIELDAPLLYEVSLQKLMKEIQEKAKRMGIKSELLEPISVKVKLKGGYVIAWKLGEEKDRAIVESEEEIISSVSSNHELRVQVQKALLNDRSKIEATEKRVEIKISPVEAVMILKSKLASEREVPQDNIEILQRKKVYIPTEIEIDLKVGDNVGKAIIKFSLTEHEIELDIQPLKEKFFEQKAREILRKKIGEEIEEISVEIKGNRAIVRGTTERFKFEMNFNAYTGNIESEKTDIKDEAIERIIQEAFPGSKILKIDRTKEDIIVDIEDMKSVRVIKLNPNDGKLTILREFPRPETIFENAKTLIENNFPISNLTFEGYEIKEHSYMLVKMKGAGGKAKIKVDPQTGDILDYYVEIDNEKAKEIALKNYPEYKVIEVEKGRNEIFVKLENKKEEIKLSISLDGKYIKEKERALKREVIESIAKEQIERLDKTATLNYLLKEKGHWKAGFSGKEKVGEIIIAGDSGEVIERIIHFTEMAIEDFFKEYIRKKYGDEDLITERLSHHKEKGYVNIKLAGKNRYYYARISTNTMEIQEEDTAPKKGLGAKLKQLQLESKYK